MRRASNNKVLALESVYGEACAMGVLMVLGNERRLDPGWFLLEHPCDS